MLLGVVLGGHTVFGEVWVLESGNVLNVGFSSLYCLH